VIQTIGFLLKFTFLIALFVGIFSLKGEIILTMFDYTVTMQTSIFVLCLLFLLSVALILYKIISSFISIPHRFSKHRHETKNQKGLIALTQGLVALSAGDSKQATYFARRSKNLLSFKGKQDGGQKALHLLLEAQTARLRGEEGLAQNKYELLMKDKYAGFLGVRGLLTNALEKENYPLALDYAQQANKLYPNQAGLVQILYALQSKNKLWSDVLKTAQIAKKIKAFPLDKITSDEVAIHLMRYDYELEQGNASQALSYLKQAYKMNNNFVPTILRFAQYYIQHGKNKKAASLIKEVWAKNPHPDLAKIWHDLAPSLDKAQSKRLQWFKTLIDINSESAESYIQATSAAMEMALWGEAKSYLMNAEKITPSARIYRLRAIIEQNTNHSEESIQDLMDKASNADPDKAWVCTLTGIIFEEWIPISAPHSSFNTVKWKLPGITAANQNHDFGVMQLLNKSALLIDPV